MKPKYAVKADMSGAITKYNVTKHGKVVKVCDTMAEAHEWAQCAVDDDRWRASNRD